jgi:hypothetical protein
MTSGDVGGRPIFFCDFRRQYNLNPRRCQLSSVSGFTTISASRQPCIRLASNTKICLSRCINCGRVTCLSSTINCCRKNMFSAINSLLLRLRSTSVFIAWLLLAGFVHCLNRDSKQAMRLVMTCFNFSNAVFIINVGATFAGYTILLVVLYEGEFYPTKLSNPLRSTFSHPQAPTASRSLLGLVFVLNQSLIECIISMTILMRISRNRARLFKVSPLRVYWQRAELYRWFAREAARIC